MDALEKQGERDKDYETVAQVLERRVQTAEDENARIAVLQKLGGVYAERLNDPRRAASAWRRVLEIRPDHSRAMRVLRDAYLAAEDFDAITELYGQNDDWEGLAEVLSSAADRTTVTESKVDLSFRVAEVFESKLQAPERAFRAYERVLSVRPDDLRAANALVPIYEKDERWSRLPALYEILLARSEDPERQLELLRKLADVTGNRLSDKEAALTYARRAFDLAPDAEGALELLEGYARAAALWEPFVEALEKRIANDPDMPADEIRALQLRLANVYASDLGRMEDAIKTYRQIVAEDPSDIDILKTLDRILRAAARQDDLRWLFELRIERADDSSKIALLTEWATLEEDAFSSPDGAIALYRRTLQLDPSNTQALTSLPRLLLAEGNAAAAAQIVETHRDQKQGAERGELELVLAELYVQRLQRPLDALDAVQRALEHDADSARAIAVLDALVGTEETRARAASLLVGVHADLGDPTREADALALLVDATTDSQERLQLLLRLIDVYELKMRDASTAFDVVLKAVTEFPEQVSLWDRARDLSIVVERPGELAQVYRSVLDTQLSLPDDIEVELCQRAAKLCREHIGDQDAAIPYLERVLARQPANEEAFKDLKEILMSRERWQDLEALYARAITGTTDGARRIEFLAEVAMICEDIIEDPSKSIDYYERILDIDPLHGTATMALEKLYASEKRYDKLVSLLEGRLNRAGESDLIAIKLRLGKLHLDNLGNPVNAMPHVEDVLHLRPSEQEARDLAERLLTVPALRARAARVLEEVYENRDEIRDLVRVLDIRLEVTEDESERRELLRRMAALRDERLADDQGAFEALTKLVPLDPIDGHARSRLIDIGRRIGEHETAAKVLTQAAVLSLTPDVQGAILMDVASIYRDHLSDVERAEAVYRRVLAIDPADPNLVLPAGRALEEIYAGLENHVALVEVLRTEVKLEDDAQRRAEIYSRLGEICENILEDWPGAIDAWRSRLEDDPVDPAALVALERLFEKVQAWRDLVSVLRTRHDGAEDADERRRLMVRIAETLTNQLQDVSEATLAWRAIVEDYGPDPSTLEALETLYEKAERWTDLSDCIDTHLNLADEPADRLALLVRLGDVRREHLQDLDGALDAFRQALTVDPSHKPSREALERLLTEEGAKREAAQVLHPLYEADGDNEKLLRVVEIEADTTLNPDERLSLLQQAVRVAEGPLDDASRAFGFAVRGTKEAAGSEEITIWLEIVERLATTTRRFSDLVTLLREVVTDILDGDVQLDVTLRIAELARTELADRELAREHYIRALDIRGDDRRALVALESLYEEIGDATALLDVIRRRVDVAENDEERKQLLFRQAKLCSDVLEDSEGAIAVFETVLDIDLDPAAVEALETLYSQAQRPSDLISLYERQLEQSTEGKAELRVKIAQVAEGKLGDTMRAFDELGEALAEDSQNEAAIAELERLLDSAQDPENRARAAEMLEPFYLGRADWKKVKRTIAARLDACPDTDKRRELLRRLAVMQEEQEEDFSAALETTAKLLHEDITDRDTWKQLESQARVAGAERRLAEIFAAELEHVVSDDEATASLARRTGELFASLGDTEKSLLHYRRALAFEPDSTVLFDAIDKLLIDAQRAKDRVELYQGALDHRFEPEDRIRILHTIAELERTALQEPDKAIETYCAALDVDENDSVSLDALTELYRQRERFADLAELYARRAENDSDVDRACEYRLALARLYRDEMNDADSAVDQLEEIVRQVPSNNLAIAELEALLAREDQKARVVDILLPLYEGADDWRKQIYLNAQRFDLSTDELERVAILRETARLWELRGKDNQRAFDAFRAAFEIDAEDMDIRQELERLAGTLGAWDELAEAYEEGIEAAEHSGKRDLLSALATIHDEKRDDPRRALDAYSRLHQLDETDAEPLEKMDVLSMLLADWQVLVSVLMKKAELIGSDEDRALAWRRVGECKRDMLEDAHGAIEAFEHALELEPASASTIDALIDLLEARNAGDKLVELYQRRVELAEGEAEEDLKYDMLLKAANRYQKDLEDNQAAIDVLRQALEVRGADKNVLSKLETLFRVEKMWPELLETLRQEATIAEDKKERASLRREIGKLLASEMAEPTEALEAFRMVLEEAPEDRDTIEAVREIGEGFEDLRLDAADILEPVLRNTSQFDMLVTVMEMRLLAQHDVAERALTLRSIATVLHDSLHNTERALEALLRALAETPEDTGLHDDIERMAEAASNGFQQYADVLEERAGKTFDAALATDLWKRLGRICEQKLENDKRAVEALSRALDQAGDEPELLASLDRLHSKLGNTRELNEILDRRVHVETTPEGQADLYHRIAVLQLESFDDKMTALENLRQALDHVPTHEKACDTLEKLTEDKNLFEDTAAALEGVYRARGDFSRLASLYEKRVSFAEDPSERLRLRLDLAGVLEEQAEDPKRAQRVIEAALEDDVCDSDVLAKLEQLAGANQQWTEACKAFHGALSKADGLDPMTLRDLYVRLADWYRIRLADGKSAESAMQQALHVDPDNLELLQAIEELQREPGRERDLIATLRRRAILDLDTEKRRELFREAKTLAHAVLADDELTEQVLRQLIELDDGYLWPYEELTQLREKKEDFAEVVELLLKRAELTAHGPDSLQLRHQAAEVLSSQLQEPERALKIYEEVFEADPMDSKAASALRKLYADQKRFKDLSELLGRLIDVASDASERTKLRLELVDLLVSRFDQVDEAVFVLLSVLDEEPGQTDAVVVLSQLYERTERIRDLADLLDTQIKLAKENGQAEAELTFTVRLGEVYETRLGDKQKAIDTFGAVLERDPSHKQALEALGRLYEATGDKQKAVETLERLLALLEGDEAVTLALRLAGIFDLMEDESGARRVLERGLAANPASAEVREMLRKLYERTGAWAEVAAMLAQDAENASDPADKVKLLQRAADIHMTKRNDAATAAKLLDQASELAPDDRELLLSLCDAYSASGRGKDAISALEKIVESYGGKRVKELAAIHHRLAKAHVSEGNKEQGLAELDQAFRITPGNLAILVDLGRLALDLGDLDRAQKTFRALLLQRLDDKAPITKAEVFYYLGEISHRQGETQRAIQMLERALENDASFEKAKELYEKLKA